MNLQTLSDSLPFLTYSDLFCEIDGKMLLPKTGWTPQSVDLMIDRRGVYDILVCHLTLNLKLSFQSLNIVPVVQGLEWNGDQIGGYRVLFSLMMIQKTPACCFPRHCIFDILSWPLSNQTGHYT